MAESSPPKRPRLSHDIINLSDFSSDTSSLQNGQEVQHSPEKFTLNDPVYAVPLDAHQHTDEDIIPEGTGAAANTLETLFNKLLTLVKPMH